jgi:hypothetical protein
MLNHWTSVTGYREKKEKMIEEGTEEVKKVREKQKDIRT